MSGTEILVTLFGLFIGYWVVSRFGSGSKGPTPPPSTSISTPTEPDRAADAAAARRQDPAERDIT